MNGVPIDSKSLNGEDFEEAIMMGLMRETNTLQKAVYKNILSDQVTLDFGILSFTSEVSEANFTK